MSRGHALARRSFLAALVAAGGCNLVGSDRHLVGGDYPSQTDMPGGSSGMDAGNGGEHDTSDAAGKRAGGRGGSNGASASGKSGIGTSGEGGNGTSGEGGESPGGKSSLAGAGSGGRASAGRGGSAGHGGSETPTSGQNSGGAAGASEQSGVGTSPPLADCFDTGSCQFKASSPLVASGNESCFLRSDTSVQCWGETSVTPPGRSFAQLAGGDYTYYGLSTSGDVISFGSGQVLGSGFIRLSGWGSMAAALRADGTVTSWGDVTGDGGPGGFWAGPIDPSTRFTSLAVGAAGICGIHGTGAATCWPTPHVWLSAGGSHTCLVAVDGTLQCWGDDSHGQASPPSSGNFVEVSAGAEHSCAITASSDIWCWGENSHGESAPAPGTYLGVAAGKGFSCGWVAESDMPRCWGDVPFPASTIPSLFDGPGPLLVAGDAHVCMLSRPVSCFGDDSDGQASPPASSYMTAIAAGGAHTCGILEFDQSGVHRGGDILCWGRNGDGQATPPAGTFTAVAAGAAHTCALDSSGKVHCWGRDDHGQTRAPSGQFVAISAGASHSCAVSVSGDTVCWGDPTSNRLNPPAPPTFSELALGGITDAVDLGFQLDTSPLCGVHTDGTPFCTSARGSMAALPEQDLHGFAIGDDGVWNPACALRADQSIACWGETQNTEMLSPPAGPFDFLTVGDDHGCGLRSNGTISCWGNNAYGQNNVPLQLAGP